MRAGAEAAAAAAGVAALLALMPLLAQAIAIDRVRQLAAKNNVTCVLVFGDSSVDSGNNNVLQTTMKSNFPPYGRDFLNGRPTGRFCNGRLATDFIAEALGYTKAIPAFLDPKLTKSDVLHGVSFASAASGYDDFTANISTVLSVSKQLEYFLHYKIHLSKFVGGKKAEEIINNAVFVVSMGTNDFIQNYYLDPTRPKQYSLQAYLNFLISCMSRDIQEMHRLGARRLVIVGIPPLGCLPLVKTLMDTATCHQDYNKISSSFNSLTRRRLDSLRKSKGLKTAFVDAYAIIQDAINRPGRYGLTETTKGCCGTGTVEYGESCKGLTTCSEPEKYVFWDAVHPTEKMYKILALEAIASFDESLLA
ncbi:GDSL esterase/lipase At5g45950 [Rhodamnia argentea]|uniref:GDSL esterase/lipase At5g45950 n=1 Tax=Rhodamnia argentea TaxID=178133 RepID=A0A8B8P4X7_9MYRT|nr:GDSL esterase/lipase At5g45950 [Rhodamnia argentea]